MLKPLELIWDRVEVARSDSASALFKHLMVAGELTVKLATLGLLSAIQDDKDRKRYRLLHSVVRGDGIGEWDRVLTDAISGPSSQHLVDEAKHELAQLTQSASAGSWQHGIVSDMRQCLQILAIPSESPKKVQARIWFSDFVVLRNEYAHGAMGLSTTEALCEPLERSLRSLTQNFQLFEREWAYIRRNYSGKYRVAALSASSEKFDRLKRITDVSLRDGIYVHFEVPRRVELLESDSDLNDFFVPNGKFSDRKFQFRSYITNKKQDGDATPYLSPASELPASETEGLGLLEARGNSWTNLPLPVNDYVERQAAQEELSDYLQDDRHPIISLTGRGGIGKTSLALFVLNRLLEKTRFTAVLWFSSRDIDLLPQGPKQVKPQVLTEPDIAGEVVRLLNPWDAGLGGFKPLAYTERLFSRGLWDPAEPVLFVFDNFETVRNAPQLYGWIDTHVRNPNKILITTRHREFKGDLTIELGGMTRDEAYRLIREEAVRIGLQYQLVDDDLEKIFEEADGHPYVMRILVGESVGRVGRRGLERVMASKEQILEALFERTFNRISPAARRVFLTVCRLRSVIPAVALEAVLVREEERIDVDAALEELRRFSFVEHRFDPDGLGYCSVPLSAAIFGRRKLDVDPSRFAVNDDFEILQQFAAGRELDVERGLGGRLKRLFRSVSERGGVGGELGRKLTPALEFVCRKVPSAWSQLASLYEEDGTAASLLKAREASLKYLETVSEPEDRRAVWRRVGLIEKRLGEVRGELHALVEEVLIPGASLDRVAEIAGLANVLWNRLPGRSEEDRALLAQLASRVMERIDQGDAIYCSRLAWLYLHLQREDEARSIVARGLAQDAGNKHILGLASKLGLWGAGDERSR